jgi:hypothetical protein
MFPLCLGVTIVHLFRASKSLFHKPNLPGTRLYPGITEELQMGRQLAAILIALIYTTPVLTPLAPVLAPAPLVPATPWGTQLVPKRADAPPAHIVHRLGTPHMDQPGGVGSLAVSPDGKWLAAGEWAMTNRVTIWDLKAGTPRWILEGHNKWIARREFSPDGEYLLVSHHADRLGNLPNANEMVVWKVQTGEVVQYHQHDALDWALPATARRWQSAGVITLPGTRQISPCCSSTRASR